MAETRFSVPQGDFDLIRYPPTRDPNLRAWDAADEFMLAHLADVAAEQAVARVFVVNDAFGALTVGAIAALKEGAEGGEVRFVSDSHTATLAMRQNVERNGLPRPTELEVGAEGAWKGTSARVGAEALSVEAASREGVDVVLIKVPKALTLLELELVGLRAAVKDASVVVGGAMTRDVHSSTVNLFEETIGPTRTTRARKKARLLLSELDSELAPSVPRPSVFELGIGGAHLVNLPGVFSAQRLDAGTRVLLDALPEIADAADVIDLGCGNGALGLAVLLGNPTAQVTFIDASRLAVASAELSVHRAFPGLGREGSPTSVFRVADCLDGLPGPSADLILCNPPFHQGRAHADDVAWKMFTGARRVLRPGGQIWVVGNRHLDYLGKLERALGNSQMVVDHPKYQVIRGTG